MANLLQVLIGTQFGRRNQGQTTQLWSISIFFSQLSFLFMCTFSISTPPPSVAPPPIILCSIIFPILIEVDHTGKISYLFKCVSHVQAAEPLLYLCIPGSVQVWSSAYGNKWGFFCTKLTSVDGSQYQVVLGYWSFSLLSRATKGSMWYLACTIWKLLLCYIAQGCKKSLTIWT